MSGQPTASGSLRCGAAFVDQRSNALIDRCSRVGARLHGGMVAAGRLMLLLTGGAGLIGSTLLLAAVHRRGLRSVVAAAHAPSIATAPMPRARPNAASKAAADHLAMVWRHSYGLPVLLSHCGNNYGPRQHPEKLIPLMALNALAGEPLPVYGDGGQRRRAS